MPARKLAPRPITGTGFRPAADVARELLRAVTPRKDRAPKRLPKEDPSLLRYVDLDGVTVTAMRVIDGTMTLTLKIAQRDHPRVELAAREAVALADRYHAGSVSPPIDILDGAPVLNVTVPKAPDALVPGATMNLRIGLCVDLKTDPVTVQAVAVRLDAIRPPQVSTPTITLPVVSSRTVTDAELGMPVSDAAQARAEAFLRAAHAYQNRPRAA